MSDMFYDAIAFNGDISKWGVSSVTSMNGMFWNAKAFNGDISKWDVSGVTDMDGMFWDAKAFNGDIADWDVTRVKIMDGMFHDTTFNGDLSKWDVSGVDDMNGMFQDAAAFNGDISKWDVSSVTEMDRMFWNAASFKRELCGPAWVNSEATKTYMFRGTSGSISRTACMSVPTPSNTVATRQHVSRRPVPDEGVFRDLIISTPIATSVSTPAITSTITKAMTCPKCGTFEKSGRKSCCAPGGVWFQKCGGARNKNVDHKWFEGLAACKRKFKANVITIHSH